jgi:[protein-PII] uridylyltransferase
MDGGTSDRIPNQRLIVDRRELVEAIDELLQGGRPAEKRGDILALMKKALADGRREIKRRFDANPDTATKGNDAVRAYSFLIDQLIRVLHDFAFEHVYPIANPTEGERQAIVAVGGYGRGELAPQSDIDLLFLLNYKPTPHSEQVIEYILYMLWDLGLKVGHATRSADDCVRMAKADQTIRTALLESRYLWGDAALYQDMRRKFRELAASDSGLAFVEAKLAERDARHKKMGDSRYVLEPNIKDGKGGLRDLHTLYWIAKYIYGVDAVRDLVSREVFTPAEAETFDRAQAFFTTVRCHLHYTTGRPEDRLTFDVQPAIGAAMGYTDHVGTTGVERFMKHYYLIAKEVGNLTRILCAGLETQHRRKPKLRLAGLFERAREIGAFTAEGGWLTAPDASVFTQDPVNLLRLFHVAQAEELDIHPAALRAVTASLPKIDKTVRRDAEANRLFIDMLTSKADPETSLRRLNEAGVFGKFVPDFGRVIAQTQHDMYHVFTVDEHTIRAIGLLHQIETGKQKDEHPLASEVVHKIFSRRALYVAVLLHDIAKGRGGDHSVLGAEVAEKLCPRFGLDDEETETVAWLVRQHLAMSNYAQKRDIQDPKTVTDFAELTQSIERLRLLLVLTVVDMRATGPHVWNGWKAALLRELYYTTEEALGGEPLGGVPARVAAAKQDLAEALRASGASWPDEDIAAFHDLGYPSYWLSLDTETQARHAAFVRSAKDTDDRLAIGTTVDTERGVTEVTVYAPDHPGLFSAIAGAMALGGASIVDAKIFTLTDGQALDSFLIQDPEGGLFDEPARIAKLESLIEDAVTGRLRTAQRLEGQESLPKRARQVFHVPPRVIVDNSASRHYTVVEVNGRDRPGFLHDVTKALTALGLQIHSAKISTFGERAVDVFYVKDLFGMKVSHESKVKALREGLMEAVKERDEAVAAA